MSQRIMENLQFALVDGAGAVTNMAVTGILTTDTIISVLHLTTKAAIESMADLTSEASITSNGNIQLASTATTNDQLLVIWSSGGDAVSVARSTMQLKISLLAGDSAETDIAVTGIATDDAIKFAIHSSTAVAVATWADITSEVSVTSAGNIQLSSTDTTDDQLILFWVDVSGVGRNYEDLRVTLLDGAAADTNIAVSGIKADDNEVLFCFHISTKASIATIADITSEVVCLSDGYIQLTDTATTSDALLLFWVGTGD